MKTLSDEDWQKIEVAIQNMKNSLKPDFCTIEGIQSQIDGKKVGESVFYLEQNAPYELDDEGKPKPQFDENGQPIPLFFINECIIIEK